MKNGLNMEEGIKRPAIPVHNAPMALQPRSKQKYAKTSSYVLRVSFRLVLGTAADFKRSELDIVGFALIGDIDAFDSCGGRTTVDSTFAGNTSYTER